MGKRTRISTLLLSRHKAGFALAEVIVALFFVTMAVALVGGLAQQLASFNKSSQQSAALMEVRSRISTINRDVDDWMSAMRTASGVSVNFASCLPDSGMVSTSFSCPGNDPNIFANDPELQRLAGPQFATVASTSIVDKRGDRIAGDLANPLYLESDGTPCTQENPNTNCPLKSTGYFLRTNPSTNSNPGDVKFYVKVERNLASTASRGLSAMKPQYTSVEVGTQWLQSTKKCSSGMKLGYLTSNEAYCVNAMSSCDVGKIAMGVDSAGNAICTAPPTCGDGKFAVLANGTGNLECMDSSPCPAGNVFLGYFGGTGEKICSSPNIKCAAGEVQVGVEQDEGVLKPVCKAVPTCTKTQSVSYTGTEFVCANAVAEIGCGPGEVLVGIAKGGKPLCENKIPGNGGLPGPDGRPGADGAPISGLDCGAGRYLQGIDAAGAPICRALASPSSDDGTMGFLGQNQLPAFTQSLANNDYDRQKYIWPLTCHVTSGSKTYQCGYFGNRFTVGGALFNVATEDKDLESVGTSSNYLNSRRCIFINGTWKMYSGEKKYNRICTGGVMYKRMEPAASRLDMRALGHPEFSGETTLAREFVSPGTLGAAATKAPSASQLMAHFNSCDLTQTAITDPHCLKLKQALDKAKRYTDLNEGSQRYPGLKPQFCQAYDGSNFFWAGCGSGCGVTLKVDYKAGTTEGTSGYRFFFRWSRNYLPASTGSNFPTGTTCTGSSGSAGTNRIRVAPPAMNELDGNESDETGAPDANLE